MIDIRHGDSREELKTLANNSVDSVVTDPPYALVSIGKRFGAESAAPAKEGKTGAYARASKGFMGQTWDNGETAFAVEFWREVYRVLKPGGYVIAFSGTRTYHRLAVAIEDAGFEIRDMISWLYGSGFPKSHDVSKGIDRAAGAKRAKVRVDAADVRNPKATGAGRDGTEGATRPWIESAIANGFHEVDGPEAATPEAAKWRGWGTALKPACEPCVLARKPIEGTVAANVLKWGTGGLNVDGCRVGDEIIDNTGADPLRFKAFKEQDGTDRSTFTPNGKISVGRWPANVIHDGSDEVLAGFPETKSGDLLAHHVKSGESGIGKAFAMRERTGEAGDFTGDTGSAARFFYTAKADATDRLGSTHPTVKPTDLMMYMIRLVTPPGGTVLDPFAGSGSTGVAAVFEGFDAILIEREEKYVADIRRRIAWAQGNGRLTMLEIKQRAPKNNGIEGDLFE